VGIISSRSLFTKMNIINKRRYEIMNNKLDDRRDNVGRDHKPDDRRDNVDKIQYNIDKTIQNIHLADEMIEKTDDGKMKNTLEEKNERREASLDSMRSEIKDEAIDKKNGYRK
jgi:small acid-soluble spore protein (thioredoxin-like protein)